MQAVIKPGVVHGTIHVPPSKSIMQRACAAALLCHGSTTILNPGISDDDTAVLDIIKRLGAEVRFNDSRLTIVSNGISAPKNAIEINCGESGLAARLFIPIAALSNIPVTITGQGSLSSRPMELYKEILPQLGVIVTSANGHLPFTVRGPLQPKDISIDGSISSQFLSGLLFAYCYAANKPAVTTIQVENLKSKAYIDLTIDVLRKYGNDIRHSQHQTFSIHNSYSAQEHIDINIESDWSSASCLMVAAAIAGDVSFTGLNTDSLQADKQILDALKLSGAHILVTGSEIKIKESELNAFEFDATGCPDLFPALAVLAACCDGTSTLHGIHRLTHKESNRVESICEMLGNLGVTFFIEDDYIGIEGQHRFEPAYIDSFNDHRIVMAASVAALRGYGAITIDNAGAVSKSYPGFFTDLQQLGANVQLKDNDYE